MKKGFYSLFIIMLCCVIALVGLPEKGEARTIKEVEQQIKQLEQQKKQTQANQKKIEQQIKEISYERAVTTEEINDLTVQINEAVAKLDELNIKIEGQEAELTAAEELLEQAIQRIEDRDNLLRSRLHFIYTNGSVSYLEVLLQSTDFSDFLDRFHALKSLVDQDKNILDSNIRDKEVVEEQKASIETMIADLSSKYTEVDEIQRSLIVKRKENEVRIASLNAHEHELEEISEEQEEALMKNASETQKLLKEKEKIRLQNFYNGGKIRYPLPNIYRLSSNFGQRRDPITGALGAMHNGIDFAAPRGTSVLAAEKGQVITAGWNGGYGNTVILDHGNGLWTLYAHMLNNSITVKVGDIVNKGSKVGQVGTTGRSTGYHLHFETRLNQKPVDPKKYVNVN